MTLAYDFVKAHGGEIKAQTKQVREVSLLLNCPRTNENRIVIFKNNLSNQLMKPLGQLLLSTFLLMSCQTLSFSQQLMFKKMPGIEPSGQVPAITQDPKGIIWFLSADELNSYDGYTVSTYKHDELNPNSPQGFRPECLYIV